MKRIGLWLALVCSLVVPQALADSVADAITTFKQAPETHSFFDNAYGYAVFPTIGKGGIGLGGAYGSGKVYRHGKLTGNSKMAQVTFGFQLGGQAYSQIIFFQNKDAYAQFTSGDFEFGAQASAVALTVGASASAGTKGTSAGAAGNQLENDYHGGMAIFTVAKGGLMYEASLGGQAFTFDPVN
ncbi:lipid-binding SYLF domain-containing protein [Ferrimonas marina]|uniref:Las17-binding protein actin regulator n=1 Tax=Ferrimonas marina TaxID=299255 RepID=A0A1M5X339_9GAMM|nr:lipid-binding SYLF domain-containing protein [Ferrimonas marina]SHH94247.1 Las17-binding protein actin regulator [Ferrimonas marina]